MGCLWENPKEQRGNTPVFCHRAKEVTPKLRTHLDPALPVWKVKSLIREWWTGFSQRWFLCHETDDCVTGFRS